MHNALSGSPYSEASWSSRPVWAPTQSFSTRAHSSAISMRSTVLVAVCEPREPRSASARHSATSSAAEEDRPAPGGSWPLISTRAATSGKPARVSSATLPRTNARQPGAGSGSSERELVALVEIACVGTDAPGAGGVRRLRLGAHGHPFGDRKRQRQPLVVVGVLADQVHAPGRERRAAISRHERSPHAA